MSDLVIGHGEGIKDNVIRGMEFPQKSKGRKDNDKPQMARYYRHFPNAIKRLFEVASFGAKKYNEPYSEINWKNNDELEYHEALYRHCHSYFAGDLIDKETGLPHLYHIMWNTAVLIEKLEDK